MRTLSEGGGIRSEKLIYPVVGAISINIMLILQVHPTFLPCSEEVPHVPSEP